MAILVTRLVELANVENIFMPYADRPREAEDCRRVRLSGARNACAAAGVIQQGQAAVCRNGIENSGPLSSFTSKMQECEE